MSSNAVEAVVQPSNFVKGKHELANLLKSVEKVSIEAVKLIADTMNSTSETVSLKTRLDCAKALVEIHTKVSEQISRDELTRQIAQVKANMLSAPVQGGVLGQPTRRAPVKDFTTIQEVK